jgi:hypothetical protein
MLEVAAGYERLARQVEQASGEEERQGIGGPRPWGNAP